MQKCAAVTIIIALFVSNLHALLCYPIIHYTQMVYWIIDIFPVSRRVIIFVVFVQLPALSVGSTCYEYNVILDLVFNYKKAHQKTNYIRL